MKNNMDIRKYAECNGVQLWQIAEGLGIADTTLSRWLRREFAPELKKEVFDIIDTIARERKEDAECS